MVRLGWLQDTHITDQNRIGVQADLVDDYNYLLNNRGVSDIYHGGDVCHGPFPEEAPHTRPQAFDRFFALVNQTDDPSALKRLVPGNHDVPLSTFLAADERCVLRDRVDYPNDNLTVLCLNTQAASFVTGSPGTSQPGGVGTEVPRVAYGDIKWLDAQLSDAAAQGHAVLIIPHASLTLLPEVNFRDVGGFKGQLTTGAVYDVIVNFERVHGLLADHAASGLDIVVAISHLYQFDQEGTQTTDGVDYVYKKHYWNGSQTETFADIQMDDAGATVTTIEHSNHATATVLDTTF